MLFINESLSKDFMLSIVKNEKEELNRKLKQFEIQKKVLMLYAQNIISTLEKIESFENTKKLSELFSSFKTHIDEMRKLEEEFPKVQQKLDAFKSNLTKKDLLTLAQEYNSEIENFQKKLDKFSKDLDKFIDDIQEFVEFKFLDKYSYTEKGSVKQDETNIKEETNSNQVIDNYPSSTNEIILENESTKNNDISKGNIYASFENSDGPVDNNCLLISEIKNKVYLPYKIKNLTQKLAESKKYNNIYEIIEKEYITPLSRYKDPILSRFKETYKLMKTKEKASFLECIDLALELSFNSTLNPAVIAACESKTELDIYLDCLYENELEQFKIFDIKYEINPMIKPNGKKIRKHRIA